MATARCPGSGRTLLDALPDPSLGMSLGPVRGAAAQLPATPGASISVCACVCGVRVWRPPGVAFRRFCQRLQFGGGVQGQSSVSDDANVASLVFALFLCVHWYHRKLCVDSKVASAVDVICGLMRLAASFSNFFG